MNRWLWVGLMVSCLGWAFPARGEEPATKPASVYGFTMKSLEGQDVPLEKYRGRVLLIVNVASKCGNTPQYKALQELHDKYKDKGFAVLGFPANDFKNQEPGDALAIRKFCTDTYHVTFDLFDKITVLGDNKAPLYQYLTTANEKYPGEIKWNFEKFLIGKDGTVANRFAPKTKPDTQEVVGAIEAELAK